MEREPRERTPEEEELFVVDAAIRQLERLTNEAAPEWPVWELEAMQRVKDKLQTP